MTTILIVIFLVLFILCVGSWIYIASEHYSAHVALKWFLTLATVLSFIIFNWNIIEFNQKGWYVKQELLKNKKVIIYTGSTIVTSIPGTMKTYIIEDGADIDYWEAE